MVSASAAFLASCLAAGTLAYPSNRDDGYGGYGPSQYIESQLKNGSVITDVLNDFTPSINVSVAWAPTAQASLGNILNPSLMLNAPSVYLNVLPGQTYFNKTNQPKLTFVMTDPDAPSPSNPSLAQICHWIATGFPVNYNYPTASGYTPGNSSTLTQVEPYINPQPPVNSTYHRYTLVALAPTNGTTAPLNLTMPSSRFRWGYPTGTLRPGLREWAATNGLTVVGANYVRVRNNSYPGP